MLLTPTDFYTTSKQLQVAKNDIVVYKKFYETTYWNFLVYSTTISNIFGVEVGDLIERELTLDYSFFSHIQRINDRKLIKVGLVTNGIIATYRYKRLHYLECVMECIIPKGAKYATSFHQPWLIASDKLIITKKLKQE